MNIPVLGGMRREYAGYAILLMGKSKGTHIWEPTADGEWGRGLFELNWTGGLSTP